MPWLTPDSLPTDAAVCRVLHIPDDLRLVAAVNGALMELSKPHNWEQYGDVTPEDTAYAMLLMWRDYVESEVCMIGEVKWFAMATLPDNVLLCDGSEYLIADYPTLYAKIGDTWGAATTDYFRVPDMRSMVPIGVGSGRSGYTDRALADVVGEETHTLTVSESASHSHTDAGHVHTEVTAIPSVGAAITGVPVPSAVPGASVTGVGYASISSVGGDNPHNNMQPSTALVAGIVAY